MIHTDGVPFSRGALLPAPLPSRCDQLGKPQGPEAELEGGGLVGFVGALHVDVFVFMCPRASTSACTRVYLCLHVSYVSAYPHVSVCVSVC